MNTKTAISLMFVALAASGAIGYHFGQIHTSTEPNNNEPKQMQQPAVNAKNKGPSVDSPNSDTIVEFSTEDLTEAIEVTEVVSTTGSEEIISDTLINEHSKAHLAMYHKLLNRKKPELTGELTYDWEDVEQWQYHVEESVYRDVNEGTFKGKVIDSSTECTDSVCRSTFYFNEEYTGHHELSDYFEDVNSRVGIVGPSESGIVTMNSIRFVGGLPVVDISFNKNTVNSNKGGA